VTFKIKTKLKLESQPLTPTYYVSL